VFGWISVWCRVQNKLDMFMTLVSKEEERKIKIHLFTWQL
jgi:hypothetical protein